MDDDVVFRALADASRRLLLDRLHAENGQTLGALCRGLSMTRQAVAKHLAILEEANLVSSRRQGRSTRFVEEGEVSTTWPRRQCRTGR